MSDIFIQNLSKSFDKKTVFKDFNLTIRENNITCIMGPSGCGKTTFLRILAGLETADGGTITGINKKKISFVFQENRLCEEFSAFSNVSLVTGKSVEARKIEEAFSALGITEIRNKPVSTFSGGMKRRVAIIRAILFDSDVLILDEPFKGLDTDLKITVMEYVKNQTKNKTVICVTHDADEARMLSGKIVML